MQSQQGLTKRKGEKIHINATRNEKDEILIDTRNPEEKFYCNKLVNFEEIDSETHIRDTYTRRHKNA